jgi:hypothetical protein
MSKAKASAVLRRYWDGYLPVDPVVIAHALGVTVELDGAMDEACGRFEFVDGRPHCGCA